MGVVNSSLMGLGQNAKFFSSHLVCVEWNLWLLHVHFREVRKATNDSFIYYNVGRTRYYYQITSRF
jgi:hypothetical protein